MSDEEPSAHRDNRVDGRLKVTGAARYAADARSDIAHAVSSRAPSRGAGPAIDTDAAEKAPGVLAVLTHVNSPALKLPERTSRRRHAHEDRLPLADDNVHYAGQHLAVVVAETFEQARDAASLMTVAYAAEKTRPPTGRRRGRRCRQSDHRSADIQIQRGDVDEALTPGASSRSTRPTPRRKPQPDGDGRDRRRWDGDRLTVLTPRSGSWAPRRSSPSAFGLPRENVRVLCPFVGGAFGCKGFSVAAHVPGAAAPGSSAGR